MEIVLNPIKEAFAVYLSSLDTNMSIYPAQEAQIALSITRKVTILKEYLDYTIVFLEELVAKLSKRFDINEHSINLELVPCL